VGVQCVQVGCESCVWVWRECVGCAWVLSVGGGCESCVV